MALFLQSTGATDLIKVALGIKFQKVSWMVRLAASALGNGLGKTRFVHIQRANRRINDSNRIIFRYEVVKALRE